MKKIFTLLTLLLCALSNVSAQDMSCSATIPAGQEGTFSNTDGIAATGCILRYSGLQGGTNIVTVNGVDYYKLGSNSAYVQLTLSSGSFSAGDVLTAIVTSNGGSSAKSVNIKVKESSTDAVSVKGTETKTITYTLKADDIEDDGSIKIYRGTSSSSNLRVATFSVTGSRAASIYAPSASIIAAESGVEVTKDIDVTGMRLSGSTLTATISPAVAGLSVTLASTSIIDGEISTTATLHYIQTENAKGTTKLVLSDGTTETEVAISYKANIVTWTLQSISTATTWDFSNLKANTTSPLYESDNKRIVLTEETVPNMNTEFVMENYNGVLYTIGKDFDGTSIAFKGQNPIRNDQFSQAGSVKFNTLVPGTIVVKFNDTGSRASATAVKRYLRVNGENTEYWTSRQNNSEDAEVAYDAKLNVVSGAIPVEPGDVTIDGSSAIQIYYVTFTPSSETVAMTTADYATYVPTMNVAVPEGAKAYIVSAATGTEATLSEVTVIPANEPVVIYKDVEAAEDIVFSATADAASDVTGNLLKTGAVASADGTQYILADGKSGVGFYKAAAGTAIAAGKAYLVSPSGAPYFLFDLNSSETTAISAVKAAKSLDSEIFNLAGQRVAQPTKGLYIVGGKKVVVK